MLSHEFKVRSSSLFRLPFAVLFIFLFAAAPSPARADTSFIPLPVYATTRNGGDEYGFMPVWLYKQQNEYVYGILAPSVVYNGNTGVNLTFRYLGYPTVDRNYRVFVNRSLKVDQEYTGEYWDDKIWGGRFKIYARASFFRDSTYRFFGLTERSEEKDETNYSNVEFTPEATIGYYLPHNFLVSYGEKLRWITVRRGTVTDLPYIKSDFRTLEGINGGAVWTRRVTLSYDTRDDEVYPSRGWYANAYTGIDHVFTHNRAYSKTGMDARKYISFKDKRFTTVIKGAFEITGGHRPPFYEESWIGGENTLRGLGTFRYRDDAYILLNVEERIRLFKMHIFGVWSDWQAAPFVDVGRVYSSFRKDFFKYYQVNPGVGFRAIVQPNVVGRVDFGFGREGLTAFVGLDFPF